MWCSVVMLLALVKSSAVAATSHSLMHLCDEVSKGLQAQTKGEAAESINIQIIYPEAAAQEYLRQNRQPIPAQEFVQYFEKFLLVLDQRIQQLVRITANEDIRFSKSVSSYWDSLNPGLKKSIYTLSQSNSYSQMLNVANDLQRRIFSIMSDLSDAAEFENVTAIGTQFKNLPDFVKKWELKENSLVNMTFEQLMKLQDQFPSLFRPERYTPKEMVELLRDGSFQKNYLNEVISSLRKGNVRSLNLQVGATRFKNIDEFSSFVRMNLKTEPAYYLEIKKNKDLEIYFKPAVVPNSVLKTYFHDPRRIALKVYLEKAKRVFLDKSIELMIEHSNGMRMLVIHAYRPEKLTFQDFDRVRSRKSYREQFQEFREIFAYLGVDSQTHFAIFNKNGYEDALISELYSLGIIPL